MEQTDRHMKAREAEKLTDLESLADALATFRQLRRDLDQWNGFTWRSALPQWFRAATASANWRRRLR